MSRRSIVRSRRNSSRRLGYLESMEPRMLLSGSAPTVSDFSVDLAQSQPYQFTAGVFESLYSDPENDALASIRIIQLPTYGLLTLNGQSVHTYQQISSADLAELKYTPVTEFAGEDYFSWLAYDGSNFSKSLGYFTFNVDGAAPTLSDSVKVVTENDGIFFLTTDFTDSYHESNLGPNMTRIKFTSLPENGILLLHGVAVEVGQEIEYTDYFNTLSHKIGGLQYIPNADYTGTDSFSWNGFNGLYYADDDATIHITVVPADALTVKGNGLIIAPGAEHTQRNNNTHFGYMGTTPTADEQFNKRTFTITNNTDEAISLIGLRIEISGLNADDFTVTEFPDELLEPGASTDFTITFAPLVDSLAVSERSATVTIVNDADIDYRFTIAGTGVDVSTAENGLQTATLRSGTGTTAALGSVLTMQYTGYMLNGVRFDSSFNLDRDPFQFTIGWSQFDVGYGMVIDGWDIGLQDIQVGEKRLLIIPAELAYGSTGSGNVLPNATLIFEVECLSVALPMVGIYEGSSNFLVTSGSTTASMLDRTLFPAITNAQGGYSTQFFLMDVGYTYAYQGYYASAVCFFPNEALQLELTGPDASYFTVTWDIPESFNGIYPPNVPFSYSYYHVPFGGEYDYYSFTVTFNSEQPVTSDKTATISVHTNDVASPLTFTVAATPRCYNYIPTLGRISVPFQPVNSSSGAKFKAAVTVTNLGDIADRVDIQIYAYDMYNDSFVPLYTLANQNVSSLKYGKSKNYTLSFKLPLGMPAGSYFLVVQVVPSAGSNPDMPSYSSLDWNGAPAFQFQVRQGEGDPSFAIFGDEYSGYDDEPLELIAGVRQTIAVYVGF
ncbi:MAG: FKBP-type peptidyl-prolyl cis-trans isomerase, partial [Phycisphaerales bacterium]|nr:FKBP-type peptidyl-prolyl cis-trans isomerase [Phycisphaerales bacterium]